MNQFPLVSVIICAYNAEDFIAETLQSVLAQTYGNLEIILVDDGSNDSTAAVVRTHFPKVHYTYQLNTGLSAARNTGIQESSGELLCFFDADDLMPRERLAMQVEFLQRHPDVGMVFCDYRNFSQFGLSEQSHFQTCPRLQALLQNESETVLVKTSEILAEENFGISGTPLIRRSLLNFVHGFEPQLRSCEDFHFFYRLSRHTQVGVINKVGMLRRVHANSMTQNRQRMLTNGVFGYSMLRDTETNPRARRLLNLYVASCWADLARIEANQGNYMTSLSHQCRALATAPDLEHLFQTLYGFTRTLAIYLGIHKSDQN